MKASSKKNRTRRLAWLGILCWSSLASLLSCNKSGGGGAPDNSASNSAPSINIYQDPLPPLPSVVAPMADPNCFASSNGNLCVFRKSAVAQTGSALADDSQTTAALAPLQTFSASIAGISNSYLNNPNVVVTNFDGSIASPVNNSWKIPYSDGNANSLAQAMSFYWYLYAAKYVFDRTGVFWLNTRTVKIFVDDAFTGWSGTRNSIHLGARPGQITTAIDPSVLVYLMGVGNAEAGSQHNLVDYSRDTNHASCAGVSTPVKKNFCCASQNGCSRAILSGAGEYFLAMVFPDKPILAETIANDPAGIGFCGLNRNLNSFANVNASQAYSACSQKNASGQIHLMGTLYASILWEIRNHSETLFPGSAKNFDSLVMQHLRLLAGEDTFLTAQAKLLLIDSQSFASHFGQVIRDEFHRRGY